MNNKVLTLQETNRKNNKWGQGGKWGERGEGERSI